MATIDNKVKSYLVVNNDGQLQDLAGNITWTNTAQIAEGAGVYGGDCLYFDNSQVIEVEENNSTVNNFHINSELYGTFPANTFNFNAEKWTLSFWLNFESLRSYRIYNGEVNQWWDDDDRVILSIGDWFKIEVERYEGDGFYVSYIYFGEDEIRVRNGFIEEENIKNNWFHVAIVKTPDKSNDQKPMIILYLNGGRKFISSINTSNFDLTQLTQNIIFCKESTKNSLYTNLFYKLHLDEFLFVEDDIYNASSAIINIPVPSSYLYDLPPSSITMEWPKDAYKKFKNLISSFFNTTNTNFSSINTNLSTINSNIGKFNKVANVVNIYKGNMSDQNYNYGIRCVLDVECPNFSFSDGELFYLNFTNNIDLIKSHFAMTSFGSPLCYAAYTIRMNYTSTGVYSSKPFIRNNPILISNSYYDYKEIAYEDISLINKTVLCVYHDSSNLESEIAKMLSQGYFQLVDNFSSSIPHMAVMDCCIGSNMAYLNYGDYYIPCAGQTLPNYKDGFPANVQDYQCFYTLLADKIKLLGGSYHYFGGDTSDDTTFTLPNLQSSLFPGYNKCMRM